jgi:hypothetical protein
MRKWCSVFTQLMALVPMGKTRTSPARDHARGPHMITHIFNENMNSPKLLFRNAFWNWGDNSENVRALRLRSQLRQRL